MEQLGANARTTGDKLPSPSADADGKPLNSQVQGAPVNPMEGGSWNREVVVVGPPLPDVRSLDGGAEQVPAKAGLFATVEAEAPTFTQQPRVLQSRPMGCAQKPLRLAVGKIISPGPPVQNGDPFLPLMALDPPPRNGDGKQPESGVDDLQAVEAGLLDVEMFVPGPLDGRLTVECNSHRSIRDIVKAAQDIEETEGGKDACKLAAA